MRQNAATLSRMPALNYKEASILHIKDMATLPGKVQIANLCYRSVQDAAAALSKRGVGRERKGRRMIPVGSMRNLAWDKEMWLVSFL